MSSKAQLSQLKKDQLIDRIISLESVESEKLDAKSFEISGDDVNSITDWLFRSQ